MFVTKRALPRRTFLRGMGATIGLPLLQSMVPAMKAAAQTAAAPARRLGFVYVPHGVILNQWTPVSSASGFDLPAILTPLEPFRDCLTIVSNLARPEGTLLQDHACTGSWLTGVPPKRTEGNDFLAARSIDQVAADEIGRETVFPSLEVATEDFGALLGACMSGYSCAYMNTLSWQTPTKPLPMEINPRVAFERMFGRAGDAESRIRRMRENRSILDSIADEARTLQQRVGTQDRARLSDYLDDVREIERRIQRTEAGNAASVTSVAAPVGIPEAFEEHAAQMFDLLAVAFQADLTRVFTYMMAREASMRTFPGLGISEAHHDVSHHGNQGPKMQQHAKITTHFMALFAKFVERLKAAPEGDGSVLDHSLIAFGTGMSDGQAHNAYPLPFTLVGGAGGRLKGNRFLVAPEWTSIANVWLSVADMFGTPLEKFGESTGRVQL